MAGSALVEGDRISFYYTGNIKLDGDFDYVTEGREANTVLVESRDGFQLGRKELLMKNEDYPEDVTRHVRDPKVWKEGDRYSRISSPPRTARKRFSLMFSASTS